MISMQEAESMILKATHFTGTEEISFLESEGRYLAENVYSDVSMPPFHKSAVDGFACRREDLPANLHILEIIPAGTSPSHKITPGTCSKIMTGAEVPEGADCVVMFEQCEQLNDRQVNIPSDKTAGNICFLGEDVKFGDQILEKGQLIRPQELGMLASSGKTRVIVAKRPKVGLIVTGSELIEPDAFPDRSSIRNSNAYQLIGQIAKSGAIPVYHGIIPDEKNVLNRKIVDSLENHPITIINGGISTGDFDLVPAILSENKVDIQFYKIAVQPGKPTLFGIHPNGNIVFGLPGNPVSSFIQFELLVKPFIQKCMGKGSFNKELYLPLGFDYQRKKAERERWEPGILSHEGKIEPLSYHGSAHLHSLTQADLIFCIPQGVSQLASGEVCRVRLI